MLKYQFSSAISSIQESLSGGRSRMGEELNPLPSALRKISYTYTAIMKLGTVIPYLKEDSRNL